MKLRRSLGTLAAAVAFALAVPASAYAVIADTPSDDEVTQIFVGEVPVMESVGSGDSNTSPGKGSSAQPKELSAQVLCVAINIVDYPHLSTSKPDTAPAVRAHGGWNKGNCNAMLADVTTQLDRKNPIGLMQAVGKQGKGRLKSEPSGGLPSSNRVTARDECNGTAKAPFRAWMNIDMVGIVDSQNRTYSPDTSDLACG